MSRFAMSDELEIHRIRTTYGRWEIHIRAGSIRRIVLPPAPPRRGTAFRLIGPHGALGNHPPEIRRVVRQLKEYFSGRRREMAPPSGTPPASSFVRRVWGRICRIPYGETRNYGAIAAECRLGRSCRAVGTACASNPLPIFIPCHRVVGKGSLGGFSAGTDWKRFLLGIESRHKNGEGAEK